MRRAPAAGAVALLAIALSAAIPCAGQPLTFDWSSGLRTDGRFADRGAGPVLDIVDTVSAGIVLSHGLAGGTMTYTLAGELDYTPQRLAAGESLLDAFVALPVESGIRFELTPERLSGLWLRAALGRLVAAEPTGLLLRDPTALHPGQLMDGLSVEARFGWFYAEAAAGYLGLLDRRVSRVRFTPRDRSELADPAVYFAPPRGLAVLRLEADSLAGGQSFALFGIGQKDFRPAPPTFDSWYVGAAARGPIAWGLRHESALVVAVTQPSGAETGAGILLSEEIAYALPGFLHETWLSVRWASGGSSGGGLATFPQLAGPPVGSVYAEPLSDIVRLELGIDGSLAVPPAGALLRPAFAVRLLLAPDGVIPAGYAFAPAGPYVGTEIELALAYLISTGIRVDALGGALVAAGGVLPYVRLAAEVEL